VSLNWLWNQEDWEPTSFRLALIITDHGEAFPGAYIEPCPRPSRGSPRKRKKKKKKGKEKRIGSIFLLTTLIITTYYIVYYSTRTLKTFNHDMIGVFPFLFIHIQGTLKRVALSDLLSLSLMSRGNLFQVGFL
jgi:hypothetical protein